MDVHLPETIKEIEGAVFLGCTSLPTIEFPPNLKEIGAGAFSGCSSLNNITFINTIIIFIIFL